jgi:hypothetical protein
MNEAEKRTPLGPIIGAALATAMMAVVVAATVIAYVALAACGESDDRATEEAGASSIEPSTSAGLEPGPEISDADVGGESGPITIALTADGKTVRSGGAGVCEHTDSGWIYGVAAALWRVEFADAEGPIDHMGLTVWRHRSGDGPDQFSLIVQTEGGSHRIDTVQGGDPVGSGRVTVEPGGEGGSFEVEGRDAAGVAIRLEVTCARFDAPEPVAG